MSISIPTPEVFRDAVVFDLGAYKGLWSREMAMRYGCRIYAFEPVFSYYTGLMGLSEAVPLVVPFHFGLGPRSESVTISIAGDGSSIHTPTSDAPTEEINLISIKDFLASRKIDHIDLMKINIEGAEFDLLEHIFATPRLVGIVDTYVIQFHSFVPNAAERHEHLLTQSTQFYDRGGEPWIWEVWTRRK